MAVVLRNPGGGCGSVAQYLIDDTLDPCRVVA